MEILHIHDPDEIVDLVGAGAAFLKHQKDRWGRIPRSWANPLTTMMIPGATPIGALAQWSRTRNPSTNFNTVSIESLQNSTLGLQLAYRVGQLDRRPMDGNAVISLAYASLRHENYVEVHKIKPSDLSLSDTIQLLASCPLNLHISTIPVRGGVHEPHSLPALTHETLPRKEASYSMYPEALPPERVQYDEAYFRRIIVVSESSSVVDLCVAWNIRAQRSSVHGYPIWITPQLLQHPEVVGLVKEGLHVERPGFSEPQGSRVVHFLSATIDADELQELIPESIDDAKVYGVEAIRSFFTDGFTVGVSEEQVVNFQKGATAVRIPDYWAGSEWSQHEWITATVAIDGYQIPRGSVEVFGHPRHGNVAVRYGGDGQSGLITLPIVDRFSRLSVPNAWEIVQGLAKQAGYSIQTPEKGQLARAVLQLLGNDLGLAVLASRPVYELLRSMAEIMPRQAAQRAAGRQIENLANRDVVVDAALDELKSGGQFERNHWERSKIIQELRVDPKVADQLIDWLVERRVLFQGYVFQCPNCGVRRWYPINRLQDVQTCDGCDAATRRPISVDRLVWTYRLNELIGQAVDQGVLPHLLALNKLARVDETENAILTVSPSLKFNSLEGCDSKEIDVDLLTIREGRLIVGECKASAGSITSKEIDRFSDLCKQLGCSRVIYAVAADGAPDPDLLRHAIEVSAPTVVQWWTADDLFNQFSGSGRLDPERYLAYVLGRIRDGVD
jgi:hypothetical protein